MSTKYDIFLFRIQNAASLGIQRFFTAPTPPGNAELVGSK
jgi:hypothetical protein